MLEGKRITPDEFYKSLPKWNREFFGCSWGASDVRQGMITLGREFISPNETFPCADDVLAEAADHSTEIDVAHYAIVHGNLPRISNNELAQQRWLSEEWSSLLGMGPNEPPEPVRVTRTKLRAAKPLDPKELAVETSVVVADAVVKKLEGIGLTGDAIINLTSAVHALQSSVLTGRQILQTNAEVIPASPVAPRTRAHFAEPDLPPSSGASRRWRSSSLDDPFDSSTWASNNAAKEALAIPRLPSPSPSPSASLSSSSPSPPSRLPARHPFETWPDIPSSDFPSSDSSRLTRPIKRRAIMAMWVDSPPSKRLRGAMSPGDNDPKPLSFEEEEEPPRQGCKGKGKGKGKAVFMEEDDDEGSGESSEGDANMNSSIIRDTPPPSQNGLVVRNLCQFRLPNEQSVRHNIRYAIQELVGSKSAREKSHAQMEGILTVMRRQQDAMITMPTGGGKSMLWLVPILLQPEWKFIVICPFTALLDEQCSKAQNAGIQAVNYSLSKTIPPDVQILFLQVEHVGARSLHKWAFAFFA